MRFRPIFFLAAAAVGYFYLSQLMISGVVAQTSAPSEDVGRPASAKDQIELLNQQVKHKQRRVKELETLISNYHTRIEQQEAKQVSLENEVAILDNRIIKKELDIERIKTELEALKLELASLEVQIGVQVHRLELLQELTAELIRRIRASDDVTPFEILLSKRSLSDFFDRVEEIKRLERDLSDTLGKVKGMKQALEVTKRARAAKRLAVEDEKKRLKKEQLSFEAEKNFKASLASETKYKQSEFERALSELREQQQMTQDDIASLETKLKDKLARIDEALSRGDVLLNWPVDPARGITSKFHDTTYPFRHLFEHPGIDIRAPVGTPVKAAAGGYVAWNKRGRLYGNYTMLIHPGNIATVYAHLLRFLGRPDTYVERGSVIGQSGGRPGDPGAGLSTGPHLHFEVRQNGIPVNPETYLPGVNEDE